MHWRVDAIEPTYAIDDAFGWVIDGRLEIENYSPFPIVAWAEFSDHKHRGRLLLATYHLGEFGMAALHVWLPGERRPDGRASAELVDPNRTRLYFRAADYPPKSTASPVLRELHAAALARGRTRVDTEQRRREGDPLILLVEQIKERAADFTNDTAADKAPAALHKLVDGLSRHDTTELLVRFAIDYEALAGQLFDLENVDDDSPPPGS